MLRPCISALFLAALLAGCGTELQPPAEGAPQTKRVTLYFLAEDGGISLGVRRDVVERMPPTWGSVARVWLLEDGEPWGTYLMQGGVDNGPFDYDTLSGFHLGAACPGTETVECDHFDALP
jgi:hypothetical protein